MSDVFSVSFSPRKWFPLHVMVLSLSLSLSLSLFALRRCFPPPGGLLVSPRPWSGGGAARQPGPPLRPSPGTIEVNPPLPRFLARARCCLTGFSFPCPTRRGILFSSRERAARRAAWGSQATSGPHGTDLVYRRRCRSDPVWGLLFLISMGQLPSLPASVRGIRAASREWGAGIGCSWDSVHGGRAIHGRSGARARLGRLFMACGTSFPRALPPSPRRPPWERHAGPSGLPALSRTPAL